MARATEISAPETSPPSHTVEVVTGLYEGITLDVAEGRYVVGSGDDADLVLMEPGLEARHAAIVLLGATARVEGLAEGITVTGVGQVPPGSARTVPLPASITIGGVEIAWRQRRAATPEPVGMSQKLRAIFSRTFVPGLATAGLLAVAVVLTIPGPFADAAVPPGGSVADAPPPIQPRVPDQPATVAVAKPPAPVESLDRARPGRSKDHRGEGTIADATSALQRLVWESGLHNVRIEAGGGGVTATGSVEPDVAGRWETLQRAFDERFLGEIALINSVTVKAEKLPSSLGIEGVWRGPRPYIILRGQRYFTGAIVDGGWAITSIEQDRVMLERAGRRVAMRF